METCSVSVIHPAAVVAACTVVDGAPVDALAETFKTLGDPTRVRILLSLTGGELCGCDLAELLGVTPSAVSHQPRLLKANRLVKARRDGKIVFYALDDAHVHDLFELGRAHVEEGRP